jgi:hypothetical protein
MKMFAGAKGAFRFVQAAALTVQHRLVQQKVGTIVAAVPDVQGHGTVMRHLSFFPSYL